MTRFDSVLNRLGARPRFVRLTDQGGRIDDVRNLAQLYIVEGTTGAAAWVRSMAPPNTGGVRVHVRVASTLELLDATALAPVVAPLELTPGTHRCAADRHHVARRGGERSLDVLEQYRNRRSCPPSGGHPGVYRLKPDMT